MAGEYAYITEGGKSTYFHVLEHAEHRLEKAHKKLIVGVASRKGSQEAGDEVGGKLIFPAKPSDALNFC